MRKHRWRRAAFALLAAIALLCVLPACHGIDPQPTAAPSPEIILWPELDGFRRSDDAADPLTAVYEADDDPYMGFSAAPVSVSTAQLDAFRQGWSAETETFLSDMLPGSVAGHEAVELPRLNRQGTQLELSLETGDNTDPLVMRALYFTLDDQLIQVLAFCNTSEKDTLQAAWAQFIARIQAQ